MILDVLTTILYLGGTAIVQLYIRPLFDNNLFPVDAEIVMFLWSITFIFVVFERCLKRFRRFWKVLSLFWQKDLVPIIDKLRSSRQANSPAEQKQNPPNPAEDTNNAPAEHLADIEPTSEVLPLEQNPDPKKGAKK